MVVHQFNIYGMSGMPQEAYPPLTVNADAPLTAAVALELFQSSGRQGVQIAQGFGVVESYEPMPCLYLQFHRPAPDLNTLEYGGGGFIREALDHLQL